MYRMLAVGIAVVFLVQVALVPTLEAVPIYSIDELERAELFIFGERSEGPVIQRLERIEREIYGEIGEGAIYPRMERVLQYMLSTTGDAPSLAMMVGAIEWSLNQSVSREPARERLSALEEQLLGETLEAPIAERVANLVQMVLPKAGIRSERVVLEAGTLVRVRMKETVDSGEVEVGGTFDLIVDDEVITAGKLVIPPGAPGLGRITEVERAGRLGRDGRLAFEFIHVETLDGTPAPVTVDERALEMNESLKLAIGASLAGMVVLGPVGLVAGLLIRGQDVMVEEGTSFYVEIEEDIEVAGLRF